MPASRQKPNAMRLASRTVCTSTADPGGGGQRGDQGPRRHGGPGGHAEHHPERDEPDPAVEPHGGTARILSPVEPAGEEDTEGDGDIDHVAALQALVAVQRDLVEDVLQGGVRPERQKEPDERR